MVVKKILIIDNDQSAIQTIIQGAGALLIEKEDITTISTPGKVFSFLQQEGIDVALVDIKMRGRSGHATVQMIKNHHKASVASVPIIVMHGYDLTIDERQLLKELNITTLVKKPFSHRDIFNAIIAVTGGESTAFNKKVATLLQIPIYDLGKVDLVAEINKKTTKRNEHTAELLNIKASILIKDGALNEAESTLKQILAIDKNDIVALNGMSKISLLRGDIDVAYEFMERAQQTSPLNVQRLVDMADIKINKKEHKTALEHVTSALAIDPSCQDAIVRKIECLNVIGDVQNATLEMEKLVDATYSSSLFNNKGVLYAKIGNFSDAVNMYKRALQLSKDAEIKSKIMYNIGLSLWKAGRPVESKEVLDEAYVIYKDNVKAKSLGKKVASGVKYIPNDDKNTDRLALVKDLIYKNKAKSESLPETKVPDTDLLMPQIQISYFDDIKDTVPDTSIPPKEIKETMKDELIHLGDFAENEVSDGEITLKTPDVKSKQKVVIANDDDDYERF